MSCIIKRNDMKMNMFEHVILESYEFQREESQIDRFK